MKKPQHTLSLIPLSKWVAYQNKYGQALDERLRDIQQMPKGESRSDAQLLYDVDLYVQNYAFWTNTSIEDTIALGIKQVIEVMGKVFIEQKKQEKLLDHNQTFHWHNDIWKVQPVHGNSGKLTKQQYDTVVDIALIVSDLQDGKHEAMYDLCSAYMRKAGEKYSPEIVDERRELMMTLPLDMALCVRKYMLDNIDKLLKTS